MTTPSQPGSGSGVKRRIGIASYVVFSKEYRRPLDAAGNTVPGSDDSSLAISFAFTSLGDAYARLGKKSEAVRLYEKALRYDSEDSETRDKLSRIKKQ